MSTQSITGQTVRLVALDRKLDRNPTDLPAKQTIKLLINDTGLQRLLSICSGCNSILGVNSQRLYMFLLLQNKGKSLC